jgi:hypothetical protein
MHRASRDRSAASHPSPNVPYLKGLEHVLVMGLYGIFLWATRTELDHETRSTESQSRPSPPDSAAGPAIDEDGGGGGGRWPLGSVRLGLPALLLFWAGAAGLVQEGMRARVNGLAAYRSHQANWVRVTNGCLTMAALGVLLAGADGGSDGGGGWRHALRIALSIGSVQVLLLCYLLLLFSSLSDGMGGLVRMVVAVVNSMG